MIGVSSKNPRSKTRQESITTRVSKTSRRQSPGLPCLALVTTALGYAVFRGGAIGVEDWNVCLVMTGLAGLMLLLPKSRASFGSPTNKWLIWTVLLFPSYIALQLVPLPLPLMRIISPERAGLFESLQSLMQTGGFVPLSIAPATTFAHLFRILAYTVTFLVIRDITAQLSERRTWATVIPLIGIAATEAALGLLYKEAGAAAQGAYGNKNHFAGLLEMVLPLAAMCVVAIFMSRPSHSKLVLIKACAALSAAIMIFLGLLYSMSKMGFVCGLFGLFVMGALALAAARIQFWKKSLALSGLAALMLFVFVFSPPMS